MSWRKRVLRARHLSVGRSRTPGLEPGGSRPNSIGVEEGSPAQEGLVAALRARVATAVSVLERLIGAGDLRVALRRLRSSPGFVVFATASLGLGISVTTTAYAHLHALLWEMPAVAAPERLMVVTEEGRLTPASISPAEFNALRDVQKSFICLGASRSLVESLAGGDDSRFVDVGAVSGDYFKAVGVTSAVGRVIRRDDEQQGRAVMVLSHRLWQRHFGAARSITGRIVRLGGRQFEVIGVAAPGFDGLGVGMTRPGTDVWIPLSAAPNTSPPIAASRLRLNVVGRLAEESDPGVAAAELATIGLRLESDDARRTPRAGSPGQRQDRRSWTGRVVGAGRLSNSYTWAGIALLLLIGLVLAVASTNLASLTLARGTARLPELAVRQALGASRWDLARPACAESVVIGLLGGVIGLAGTHALLGAVSPTFATPRGLVVFGPELGVGSVWFALAVLLLTLLVFGVEPALLLSRVHAAGEATTRHLPGVARTRRSNALLRWQVVVSALFLLVAGYLTKVVIADLHHDSGVRLDRLALATVHFEAQRWDEDRARRSLDLVLDNARRAPGIEDAVIASGMPFGLSLTARATVRAAGHTAAGGKPDIQANLLAASPGIFEVLGVSMKRGRAWGVQDAANAVGAAVVSERTARALFGTVECLGRQVTLRAWERARQESFTIVGVARDTDGGRMHPGPGHTVYVPLAQHYEPNLAIIARATATPGGAAEALRLAIRKADPDLAIGTAGAATDVLGGSIGAIRIAAAMAAGLGVVTLLLVLTGLYGVLSSVVGQRAKEIAVRMALGATKEDVVAFVLRRGLRPVLEGITIGFALWTLGQFVLRARLTDRRGLFDIVPYAIVLLALGSATLLACYAPARRAARGDPSAALRDT